MRATVLHLGVPIGEVELPDDRPWAGGLLEPSPAYEAVAVILREAVRLGGPLGGVEIYRLQAGAEPDVASLEPVAADAVRRAAALDFDLADERGRRIPAETVRVVDLDDGRGGRVAAYFRTVNAGVVAAHRPRRSSGGDAA